MKYINRRFLCSDELVCSEDYEIIEGMKVLNCRGNQYGLKFQVLWYATALVIETDTGAGSHLQRHAASNKEMTLNVLCAPEITSMYQLIEKTEMLMVETDKKRGSRTLCPVFILGITEIVALLQK